MPYSLCNHNNSYEASLPGTYSLSLSPYPNPGSPCFPWAVHVTPSPLPPAATCTVWNKFRLLLLENRLVPSHVCLLSLPNDKNFYTFWMEDISYSFATFTTLSLVLTSDKNSHTSSSEGHKSILTFNLIPSAWVSFCRSDPAKSTKLSREVRMFTVSLLFSIDSIVIVKTAWDLEDSLFIDVDATRLFLHPPDNTWQKENVLSRLLSGHNSH